MLHKVIRGDVANMHVLLWDVLRVGVHEFLHAGFRNGCVSPQDGVPLFMQQGVHFQDIAGEGSIGPLQESESSPIITPKPLIHGFRVKAPGFLHPSFESCDSISIFLKHYRATFCSLHLSASMSDSEGNVHIDKCFERTLRREESRSF